MWPFCSSAVHMPEAAGFADFDAFCRQPPAVGIQLTYSCVPAYPGHALIGDVIDTDQEEGMLVAAGVSDTLDGLKQTYAGLPDFLTQVVNAELARVPRHLSDALADQLWSIVYMPQVECVTRLFGAYRAWSGRIRTH